MRKLLLPQIVMWICMSVCLSSRAGTYTDSNGIVYESNGPTTAWCMGVPEENRATFTLTNLTIMGEVTIDGTPHKVTYIAKSAFDGCSNITGTLTFPASVTSVGQWSFRNCSGLTGTLDLTNFETVAHEAFQNCTGFDTLIMGEKIKGITYGAFDGCSGFKGELDLSHVVTINQYNFRGCTGFTSLKLGENLANAIGIEAFKGCTGFKGDLIIPDKVTSIAINAFEGCTGFDGQLKFGESLTSISKEAFKNCSGFTKLDLNKVEKIGDKAFQNCKGFKGDLVIPHSVKGLGAYAFDGCSGFDGKLDLSNLNEAFGSYTAIKGTLDHYVFRNCSGLKGDLIIPDIITDIMFGVFDGCSGFDGNLKISDNVEFIGPLAFRNCSNLKGTLTFPASLKYFGDPGYGYYAIHAFKGCSGFTKVEFLGNEINSIPESIFEGCEGLTGEIVLPNITEEFIIDKRAFFGCKNITGIKYDDRITTIGEEAFSGCENLTALTLPKEITEVKDKAFYGCTGLKLDFIIPESVKFGEECFSKSGLTGVVIPSSSNLSVADNAFSDLPDCKWFISLSDSPTPPIFEKRY